MLLPHDFPVRHVQMASEITDVIVPQAHTSDFAREAEGRQNCTRRRVGRNLAIPKPPGSGGPPIIERRAVPQLPLVRAGGRMSRQPGLQSRVACCDSVPPARKRSEGFVPANDFREAPDGKSHALG